MAVLLTESRGAGMFLRTAAVDPVDVVVEHEVIYIGFALDIGYFQQNPSCA